MRLIVLFLAIFVFVVPSVHGAWSSFHSDERNSGYQPGTTYQVYDEVWWNSKLQPATQMESSPVVSGSTVIFAGWDKIVRARDVESGSEKWTAIFGAKIVGTPAIASGKVFVIDSAGSLKAFDLEKGTELGAASVGATLASPTIHEGKLFIGNEAGEMKAYDTETLTLLWKFSLSSLFEEVKTTSSGTGTGATSSQSCDKPIPAGQIRGAPVVFNGLVIFGSLNYWVFALDEHGEPGQKTFAQWIFKTNDAIFGSPTIDQANGRVIIGSYDEKVYSMPASPSGKGRLYASSGSSQTLCSAYRNIASWTFNVPSDIGTSKIHSSPATDGTNAYFGANNGRVYAIKLSDGTKVWDFATGGAVISSPAVSNNIVVVGSDDGKVYWLRANNGTEAKSFRADAPIKSSPAIDGARTYVASFEGSIYMFGPEIPKRPDLMVQSITYLDGVISIVVQNSGTGAAGANTLRLIVDGALEADLQVPTIAAGQTAVLTHAKKLATGDHSVSAQVDQGGVVQESGENNNAQATTLSVAAAKGGGGGVRIPGAGLPLILAALALVSLLRRTKRLD